MFKTKTIRQLRQALMSAVLGVLFVVSAIVGFGARNAQATAGVPLILNYQARVTNATGTPVTAATNMRFEIFDAVSSGNCVWSGWGTGTNGCGAPDAGAVAVTPVAGVFSIALGDTTVSSQKALQSDIFNDDSRYLEIQMYNGATYETLGPRKRILSAPYAMNSNLLAGLAISNSGGSNAFVPVTDSSGNLTLTGTLASAAHNITSTAAGAFVVGANGATNPVLQVNAATGSVATGLLITGAATGGTTAITATDSGTNSSISLDAKGAGTITINGTATGGTTIGHGLTLTSGTTLTLTGDTVAGTPTWSSSQAITLSTAAQTAITSVGTLSSLAVSGALTSGAHTITSTAAGAFVVGANGATNPVLQVNAATGSVATGLLITGAATGGTTAITATDSGAASSISLNAKGTGTVTINGTATGGTTIGNASAGAFGVTTGTAAQTFTSSNASGTGASSSFVFTDSALAGGTLMRLNSTSTSGLLMDMNITNTTGTVINASYGAGTVQGAGALTGMLLDFNTNLTVAAAGQNFTGINLKLPPASITSNGPTYSGFNLSTAGAIVNGGSGTFTWNGANIQMPNITQTSGAITSNGISLAGGTITTGGTQRMLSIANITTPTVGSTTGLFFGTGWSDLHSATAANNNIANIVFSASSAGANANNFTIKNSAATMNNLFELRDLTANTNAFGGLAVADAFMSRQSYFGEEFDSQRTNCNNSSITTVTNNLSRGTHVAGGVVSTTACTTTGTDIGNSEISTTSVSTVISAADLCNYQSGAAASNTNGYEAIIAGAGATTDIACLEYVGTASDYTGNMFVNTNNLPQIQMKFRPVAVATAQRFYIGVSTRGTAAVKMLTSDKGMYFTNCTAPTTPTCGTTLAGIVSDGATVPNSATGTNAVGCPAADQDGNSFTANNWMYGRIETRKQPSGTSVEIQFFVDYDVTNGIHETSCGTVTAIGASGGLNSRPMTTLAMVNSIATGGALSTELDIDYQRIWQDDNMPSTDNASTDQILIPIAPVGPDQATIDLYGGLENFNKFSSMTSVGNAQPYGTSDKTLDTGDLVGAESATDFAVKKSDSAYGDAAGVVTALSNLVMSVQDMGGSKTIAVALSGRVPVKVVGENGAIAPGDYLVASGTPGAAMKATRGGMMLGRALTAYDDRGTDAVGMVMVDLKGSYMPDEVFGPLAVAASNISDASGIAPFVLAIQTEAAHDSISIIVGKVNGGVKVLSEFVSARVTAIRGYFDEVFMNRSHQKVLCIGDAADGGETCVTKSQLDQMMSDKVFGNFNAPSAPAPVSDTPPPPVAETPTVETPPAADTTPPPASEPVATELTPSSTDNEQPTTDNPPPAADTPPADTTPPPASEPMATEPTPSTDNSSPITDNTAPAPATADQSPTTTTTTAP